MANIVIVGAGLAGSLLAGRLAAKHRVTVIEQSALPRPIAVVDRGRAANLAIHVAAGPGGTTSYWHNGLIALEDDDHDDWPLPAAALRPYLAPAHRALSGGAEYDGVNAVGHALGVAYEAQGVPRGLLGHPLFYPSKRMNAWASQALEEGGAVRFAGKAERIALDEAGRAQAVIMAGGERIAGDVIVVSAGGLGSPLILSASGASLAQAGRNYYDHPVGFVGEIKTRANFNGVWNRLDRKLRGSVRVPLVIREPGQKFAFYLRPAGPTALKAKSVLSDLRNAPMDPRLYLQLMMQTNDLVEALSLKAGINIPTSRFVLYMSAQQRPQANQAIGRERETITRDWRLDDDFVAAADRATNKLMSELAPVIEKQTLFPNWLDDLQSGAHHSGTCRMAATPDLGVCDSDLRVFGTDNLYVCDASVLPSAGYANTGLTIGALALRLAETLDA